MNKNIYLLPTDKPSKLLKTIPKGNFILAKENTVGSHWENFNLYITNDKEIKEGFVTDGESVFKVISNNFNTVRLHDKHNNLIKLHESRLSKIILTTDQDLIKDGVQSIDDELLEWFVKNPSCEFLEVQKFFGFAENYLIIIPQEEPKQETLEEAAKNWANEGSWCCPISFEAGAKWQAERMYSEEEIVQFTIKYNKYKTSTKNGVMNFAMWFEQFKKK